MRFKYELQFDQDIIMGSAKKMGDIHEERKCYTFTLGERGENKRKIRLLSENIVNIDWIHGPACLLDRKLIYPCSRFRCSIPCPCKICHKVGQSLSCQVDSSESCACSNCVDQYQDHSEYHRAYHMDCKFCKNIIHIFPAFNYWFLNKNIRMLLQGCQSREHFYMKKLVVNTKPTPEAVNTNMATNYKTYETN